MKTFKLAIAAVAGISVAVMAGAAGARGVSDKEVVLGTHTDLSGPAATWGVGSTNGIRLRFKEVNDEGGVNGRKIRFVVEDSQYQVPRAVQAANKLINRDRIFAMVGALGTPMNNAVMKRQLAAGIPNLFPFTASQQMVRPFHKMKFGAFPTYYDQIRAGVKFFVEKRGKKAVCAMYQDTDYGQEILDAATDQLKAMNMSLVARTAHKPTDSDFTSSIAKLKKANCDLVVLGSIVRDTIIPVATAKKMGWKVDFLGSTASLDFYVSGAKGGITEGYYAMSQFLPAYEDTATPIVKKFFADYRAAYGKEPNIAAQVGYMIGDLVVMGLDRAGRKLTTESFIKGLESIKGYHDIFGGPELNFSADQHLGTDKAFLMQVRKGRWERVTKPLSY